MSRTDDRYQDERYTDEQLDLWVNWEPEPPGIDPSDGQPDQLDLIGPHLWCRGQWRPVEDAPSIDDYQPAA